MMVQSNDTTDKYWKGVGCGIHRSDVICSIVGYMVDAGESLEYGKNHDGYWNGEMFVKQLQEKIIPTFECLHGPEYQVLFLIDNSQGHSAYAEDVLAVSRMNVNPGGKQACMRNGWFTYNGVQVEQEMVFTLNHPHFPNQPKGLYESKLCGKCIKCNPDSTACCNKHILEVQPDFQQQRSSIQEVIENAGHLCIFLPKFHCELNFIEYFWGKVKKYLQDNCNGTFNTLKTNMPLAMQSVQLSTI
ncbi:hypothetical protein K503DRAFT_818498 [Rhizopogon vinicolor AM-OR11-026]|uniref:Tc1-like transposase DDE domain-containing protein n=1 Tax=Rhizopogon vinicolor AM-OR11-026 TaxID=1314800 RepID=A0A1B7MDQ2_9AGAM|nr:hypothetical protein K503DRAFT_818498 [Rhizopogon vinicolor AM-OR11-026]